MFANSDLRSILSRWEPAVYFKALSHRVRIESPCPKNDPSMFQSGVANVPSTVASVPQSSYRTPARASSSASERTRTGGSRAMPSSRLRRYAESANTKLYSVSEHKDINYKRVLEQAWDELIVYERDRYRHPADASRPLSSDRQDDLLSDIHVSDYCERWSSLAASPRLSVLGWQRISSRRLRTTVTNSSGHTSRGASTRSSRATDHYSRSGCQASPSEASAGFETDVCDL